MLQQDFQTDLLLLLLQQRTGVPLKHVFAMPEKIAAEKHERSSINKYASRTAAAATNTTSQADGVAVVVVVVVVLGITFLTSQCLSCWR